MKVQMNTYAIARDSNTEIYVDATPYEFLIFKFLYGKDFVKKIGDAPAREVNDIEAEANRIVRKYAVDNIKKVFTEMFEERLPASIKESEAKPEKAAGKKTGAETSAKAQE